MTNVAGNVLTSSIADPLRAAITAAETGLLAAIRPDRRGRRVATIVSEAAHEGRLWLLLSAAGAASPRTRSAARDGLAGWAAASTGAFAAKQVIGRRRPRVFGAVGSPPRSSSMPSAHTAGAVAYATAATLAVPLTGVVVWPAAAAVAWSRTASGRHFPTDVAAGAALGAATGAMLHVLLTRRAGDEARAGVDQPVAPAEGVSMAAPAPAVAAKRDVAK